MKNGAVSAAAHMNSVYKIDSCLFFKGTQRVNDAIKTIILNCIRWVIKFIFDKNTYGDSKKRIYKKQIKTGIYKMYEDNSQQ